MRGYYPRLVSPPGGAFATSLKSRSSIYAPPFFTSSRNVKWIDLAHSLGSFKLHFRSILIVHPSPSFTFTSSCSLLPVPPIPKPFLLLLLLLLLLCFLFRHSSLSSSIFSLMSLNHYPILTDRRFQPTERSSYDSISLSPSEWNYPSRSQNDIPHDYSSSWNVNLLSNWSTQVIPSPSPVPSSSYSSAPPTLRSAPYYAYPDPSNRSLPPTSPPSLSAGLSSPFQRPTQQYRSPSAASTFKFDDPSWAHSMYSIDDRSTPSHSLPPPNISASPSARASSRTSSSRSSPVKLESDEGSTSDCFVMEFSTSIPAVQDSTSLAPPTEVPLRATQASKAMRKMMGVFRLNPFSMHEGGGQAMSTWVGEEAGPLEEEPQFFEFQLDIGYRESDEEDDEQPPRKLQTVVEVPEPELDETTRWAEGDGLELSYPPLAINESEYSSYTLPSLRSYTANPHSPSLSSASSRKTPSASEYTSAYTLHGAGSCGSSTDNLPSLASMARRWAIPANLQAPFMI